MSVSSPTFELQVQPEGSGARLEVRSPGGEIFTDLFDPLSAAERERVVKGVIERFPALDRADVQSEVECCARMIANGQAAGGVAKRSDYRSTADGLVWDKLTKEGAIPTLLTNFTARIVASVVEDDGQETRQYVELEGSIGGRTAHFVIPAKSFNAMTWPLDQMGPEAVVYAGFGLRDHARVAIQVTSEGIQHRTIYTHSGWRKLHGAWAYLHGGGAIGPDGPIPGIEVDLPGDLSAVCLPDPPSREELVCAIHRSLSFLDLAPDRVSCPLFAAVWAVVLFDLDFSICVTGPTGVFKTEVAAVFQSFWGWVDALHLVGWSSTSNYLEQLAFTAKDVGLVVDDFIPTGSTSDIQRRHREADRLLRAQGNRAGRGRLRADSSPIRSRPPRGLILSTGEVVPQGHSLRARMLVLELSNGEVAPEDLSRCQEAAREGIFARCMAGFVRDLAPRRDEVLERSKARFEEARQEAQGWAHRRTCTTVARLQTAFEVFLGFAQGTGALTEEEVANLKARCRAGLQAAAREQEQHQIASEPTQAFTRLLAAALATGQVHVAAMDGAVPEEAPGLLGWRSGEHEWRPLGDRVGWIDKDDLYVDPDAAYRAAQGMAAGEERIAVPPRTLNKRLSEQGLLVSEEHGRGKHTVRKMIEGRRIAVLHLRASSVVGEAQSAQRSLDSPGGGADA